jgi:hypothetical protein
MNKYTQTEQKKKTSHTRTWGINDRYTHFVEKGLSTSRLKKSAGTVIRALLSTIDRRNSLDQYKL